MRVVYSVAWIAYPVIVSLLLSTLFYNLSTSSPQCSREPRSILVEETADALSSFGGLGTLAETSKDNPRQFFFAVLLVVFSFFGTVIFMTFLLLFLYRYGLVILIRCWLMISSFVLLSLTSGTLMIKLCHFLCIHLDWITLICVVWNFTCGGVVSIFYYAPRWSQHTYLVLASALMSWLFRDLPEWATWLVLLGLAIWDLFAVLSPFGPLRGIVELAEERGERNDLPALVYDTCPYDPELCQSLESVQHDDSESTMEEERNIACQSYSQLLAQNEAVIATATERDKSLEEIENNEQRELLSHQENIPSTCRTQRSDCKNDGYIKLGLGDFVFYNILVAKSSQNGILTWFACLLAVMNGLCLTLFILVRYRKALPALPISIVMGLLTFLLTQFLVIPFSNHLGASLLLL
eukprot:jgi/Galph1/4743/GphlegSOOS_G3374.1